MAEGIRVGSVAVEIVPDASNFGRLLGPQVTGQGDAIGREIGQRISAQIGDGVVRGINDGAAKGRAASARAGAESGGAFADSFKARVDAALRSLPDIKINADSSDADRRIAAIRADLEALSGKRIGVDLSADEALAKLADLRGQLDDVGAKSPNVQVRVDAARAATELAAVQEQVDRLDGDTAHVTVDVDTSGAGAALGGAEGLGGLSAAGLSLGAGLIPVGAAATAGLAGIATTAASGAAALGVLGLGFSSVTTAVKGLQQEHELAAQQAAKSAASEARTSAAQVAAANQVASATGTLALARQQAASQEIAATEAVQRAQFARTQADQQEVAALQQLHDAREQAARDLESSANREVDARLAAQQAALSLTTAEQNLAQVMTSPTATATQRQQAELDVAKAKQALIEANEEAKHSEQDNTAAQKAGVNGSAAVVAATKAVATAKHNQAQAGQALTDAERQQSLQRQQSAFTIEQAQRALATAEAAQATAATNSGTAGAAALAKVQESLKAVSPAALAFAGFFETTLLPAFHRLQGAAAAGFLPGLEAGLKALAPLFQPFTAFVGSLAGTMGTLFKEAGKALGSPFWRQFFDYVARTAGPTLVIMGRVIGDIATGFAGLMEAFAPVVSQLGGGISTLAGNFADFGKHLGTNGAFQSFLAYIKTEGPVVADLIGKLFAIIGKILPILAPFGDVVLKALDGIAGVILKLPPGVILAIGAALAVAFGGPLTIIAAVAAALAYAYAHSESFRRTVKTLATDISNFVNPILQAFRDHWGDIKATIAEVLGWISDHVGPALSAMGQFFVAVVGVVQDLWDRFGKHLIDHLKVAWSAIAEVLSGAFKVIQGIFEIFTGILTGKWGKVWTGLKDVLDGIWKIIQGVVRTALNLVSTIIGAEMAVISEVWSKAWALIKSAADGIWGGIKAGAKDLWGDIKGFFVTGINDVTGLLNEFIHAVDDVLKFFHLPTIPTIPKVGTSTAKLSDNKAVPGVPHARFAAGGVVAGYAPGVDSVPAMLSPGEAVLRPEVVRSLGPATIHAWNHHAVHMKGGGIFGDALSALGGALHVVEGLGHAVLQGTVGPAMTAAEAPIHAAIGLLAPGMFRDLANGVINDTDHGIRHMLGISYDEGGLLQPGYQLAYNGTGSPEIVAPAQTFQQAIGAMQPRGGMHIENLNVRSAPGEKAATSVPRALREHAYVAGLW